MNKRWICPKCNAGKLAPSKPRRDDTRRYCLPCSEKTGRLVERACPALEAERAARADAAKAKAAKVAERRKTAKQAAVTAAQAKQTIGGAFLPDHVQPFWRVLCEEARKAAPRGTFVPDEYRPPVLEVAASKRPNDYYRGWGTRTRAFVRFGPDVDRARALVVLLHELAHGATIEAKRRGEGVHGPTFRKTLRNAAARLWGIEVSIPTHRYVLDDLIVVELRKKLGLPEGPTGWLDRQRRKIQARQRPAAVQTEATL